MEKDVKNYSEDRECHDDYDPYELDVIRMVNCIEPYDKEKSQTLHDIYEQRELTEKKNGSKNKKCYLEQQKGRNDYDPSHTVLDSKFAFNSTFCLACIVGRTHLIFSINAL